MRAINDSERETFNAIREASNIALVSTELDGQETAAIAAIVTDDDGNSEIHPLAVLVTDAMFARLAAPDSHLT